MCEINVAVQAGTIEKPKFVYLATVDPTNQELAGWFDYFEYNSGILTLGFLDYIGEFPSKPFGVRVYLYDEVKDNCD